MESDQHCCPHRDCSDCGKFGKGNIHIHSQKEQRFRCKTCKRTFSATYGTPLYRRQYTVSFIACIITLLAFGCPLAAIVQAFSLDPRTVKSWWRSSGEHCKLVHEATILGSRMDLVHVQLDEIRHKIQGSVIWIAMVLVVPTRLWLGAVISVSRNKALITELVSMVKQTALARPLLICFDGLKTYIKACQKAFRVAIPNGKVGRNPLIAWPNICLGGAPKRQIIKQYAKRKVTGVKRVIIQGTIPMVNQLIHISQNATGVLNTAFIERLNATFRSRLALLTRRTKHPGGAPLARKTETITQAIYLVGCVYNFCTFHHALRKPFYVVEKNQTNKRWAKQTPAMAAGITKHKWTVLELLKFKISPPELNKINYIVSTV